MAKQERTTYEVLTAFPYRGRWTVKGQPIDLLPVEAAQLERAKRIRAKKSTKAAAKPAEQKAD